MPARAWSMFLSHKTHSDGFHSEVSAEQCGRALTMINEPYVCNAAGFLSCYLDSVSEIRAAQN
jgi:hypothetical protein